MTAIVYCSNLLYSSKQRQGGATAYAVLVHEETMVRRLRDYLCTGCRCAKDPVQENGATTVVCTAAGGRIDAVKHQSGMRFEDCHHRLNPHTDLVTPGAELVRLAQIARTIGTANPTILQNYES